MAVKQNRFQNADRKSLKKHHFLGAVTSLCSLCHRFSSAATILAGNYCYLIKLVKLTVTEFVSVRVVCAMMQNPFYFSDSMNNCMLRIIKCSTWTYL